MNKIDYQIADNLCSKILEEFNPFPEFDEMLEWLEIQKDLYDQFNIEPYGLPAICNRNFEGIRYENIAKFHSLYQKVEYEWNILDHMPHEIAIMYFFEQMNAFMLGHYLTEEFYMGKDQPDFFYALGNAFQELQNRGNKQLYSEMVECNNCKKKQYFFKGFKDDSYLHLIFKIENGIIKDLIECRETKCALPNNIDTEKQVFLDTVNPPF